MVFFCRFTQASASLAESPDLNVWSSGFKVSQVPWASFVARISTHPHDEHGQS